MTLAALLVVVSLDGVPVGTAQNVAQAAALKIVVLEGEGAINIIRQKTATAPVVEVRDRNDLPVAGASVTFTIGSGSGASFGGAQTLTVITNATGRAVAAGLTPTSTGAVQIGATAAFQGQTAVATIAQTNVMTAAQAAGASGAGSAGSGAAGGGGGGISGTTLGVVGAAAVGGAVVATKALRRSDGKTYTGALTGPLVFFFPAGAGCTRTEAATGTLTLTLQTTDDWKSHIRGHGSLNDASSISISRVPQSLPRSLSSAARAQGGLLPRPRSRQTRRSRTAASTRE